MGGGASKYHTEGPPLHSGSQPTWAIRSAVWALGTAALIGSAVKTLGLGEPGNTLPPHVRTLGSRWRRGMPTCPLQGPLGKRGSATEAQEMAAGLWRMAHPALAGAHWPQVHHPWPPPEVEPSHLLPHQGAGEQSCFRVTPGPWEPGAVWRLGLCPPPPPQGVGRRHHPGADQGDAMRLQS